MYSESFPSVTDVWLVSKTEFTIHTILLLDDLCLHSYISLKTSNKYHLCNT